MKTTRMTYYRDYKCVPMIFNGKTLYYCYHYKIGFSATFNTLYDVRKYMEGVY